MNVIEVLRSLTVTKILNVVITGSQHKVFVRCMLYIITEDKVGNI